MRRLALAFGFTSIVLISWGCDSGPKTYRVTGTVTWQNQPVEDGQIIFEAEDGQTHPAAGNFQPGGKYELRIAAGTKRVKVHAQRSKGFDKVMNQETYEAYIPAEYDAKSTLKFEVQPHDDNVFDLKLPIK